jgi:cellulose synthase/poly-beta-1,6-N-acetylglucosamine synthase-like glycosyltransferase
MFPVKGAIFVKFQLFLGIAPVYLGGIVFPFTFIAMQRNKFYSCLFTLCHINLSNY